MTPPRISDWRFTGDNEVGFDEVVVGDWLHAEMMDDDSVFVNVAGRAFWIDTSKPGGKITMEEDRRCKECGLQEHSRRCKTGKAASKEVAERDKMRAAERHRELMAMPIDELRKEVRMLRGILAGPKQRKGGK